MSNFLTQFSSGNAFVDVGFMTMTLSMILIAVAVSTRLSDSRKGDAEPERDTEVIEIVALLLSATSLATLVIARIITDTPMTVAQCLLVILASIVCAAPFIVNFVLTRVKQKKEQHDGNA